MPVMSVIRIVEHHLSTGIDEQNEDGTRLRAEKSSRNNLIVIEKQNNAETNNQTICNAHNPLEISVE